jgi:hypothetical protein
MKLRVLAREHWAEAEPIDGGFRPEYDEKVWMMSQAHRDTPAIF